MKKHHLLRNQLVRIAFFAGAIAIINVAAIMIGQRYAPPSPLTPKDTREVIAAINKISPGSRVANFKRGSDGKIRAFVPGDPLGGQIVVVTKSNGVWRAVVEKELF
jgi:hypothetical protein